MSLFTNCHDKCCVCYCYGNGCLAGNGDDDFHPATQNQLIERIDKCELDDPNRNYMIGFLRSHYEYDYDLMKNHQNSVVRTNSKEDTTTKEIHFYEYYDLDHYLYRSWNETQDVINRGDNIIHTVQMGFLSTELVSLGYRIFVHESPTEFYEIVIDGLNTRTKKALRMEHNLFKMWRANAFRKEEGK